MLHLEDFLQHVDWSLNFTVLQLDDVSDVAQTALPSEVFTWKYIVSNGIEYLVANVPDYMQNKVDVFSLNLTNPSAPLQELYDYTIPGNSKMINR